ncbi:TlpA family protein disulfide reductase [Parasedimentitalea huanghaiensis]|uniref:Redoxin domain-containing protein n=1 Tax=Parasedimentitalea huanghaiensis TaxID=2682100 RepID=A0A6L6WEL3_9RHOB|nr:deiodinase-like protein [Zongyanglinia huanghaiensis]MVO16323.1 redoxin domain-containing protein [Zongyanglinia huanghaiensis]
MPSYNYDEFSPDDYDFDTVEGPVVGQKAPDFELTTSDGRTKRLLDFEGDFLVLEIGSITCPLFQSRRGIMQPLQQEFPQISSAVLYVREAHPGVDIPGHQNFDDKLACATRLKSEDGETRTVFVDDFEGAAHLGYGSMPNAVFIIDRKGCVRFQAEWNNPSATRKALAALIAGKPVRVKSYFRPALPPIALKTLGRAGRGSAGDFFRGLPFLIWTNLIKRNLRLLFNQQQGARKSPGC